MAEPVFKKEPQNTESVLNDPVRLKFYRKWTTELVKLSEIMQELDNNTNFAVENERRQKSRFEAHMEGMEFFLGRGQYLLLPEEHLALTFTRSFLVEAVQAKIKLLFGDKNAGAREVQTSPPAPEMEGQQGDTFSTRLQTYRKRADLTQEQLAFRSGVTQSQISKLERGVWEPQLSTLLALAKALSIDPCALIPKAP